MTISRASATWQGDLPKGAGHFSAGSGTFAGDYSAATRFEGATGTTPEELLAAAHAACFSMALEDAKLSASLCISLEMARKRR